MNHSTNLVKPSTLLVRQYTTSKTLSGILGPKRVLIRRELHLLLPTPAHQHTTQDGVQAGTPNPRLLTLQKTVKYCTDFHRNYHTESECRIKYPNLAPGSKFSNNNRKRRRGHEGKKGSEDSKNGYYFAEGDLVTSMAVQSTSSSMFENAWVWDCGCFQHVTSDRSTLSGLITY